jgi:hypothetical protein
MGIYRTFSYKVEDLIIKMLSKNLESEIIKEKVVNYRTKSEEARSQKKMNKKNKAV